MPLFDDPPLHDFPDRAIRRLQARVASLQVKRQKAKVKAEALRNPRAPRNPQARCDTRLSLLTFAF
jgi:hypothetical protein